jgi:hypothetical protein
MRIRDTYTHARDPRWQGGQKLALKLIVLITIFWLLVWIFIIAAMGYSYDLWREYKRISDASGRKKDPVTGYMPSLGLDWYPPLDYDDSTIGGISSAR